MLTQDNEMRKTESLNTQRKIINGTGANLETWHQNSEKENQD